jgi:hypothetical protein
MKTSAKKMQEVHRVTMGSIPDNDMKYRCLTWEVHTLTHSVAGSTYVQLWQVQSPSRRVAKMIKPLAKLMNYDE